jgi:tight adherence protein B
MLYPALLAVFLAAFFSVVAVYAVANEKLGTQQKRIKERIKSIAQEIKVEKSELTILRDEKVSEIPAFNRFLSKIALTKHLQKQLDEAGIPLKAGALILGMLSLGGFAYLLFNFLLKNQLIALLIGLLVLPLPYLYVLRRRNQRRERFDSLLPEGLDLICNALKAGFSFESAMRMVAQEIPDPVGIEFALAFEEQNLGLSLTDALTNLGNRVDSDDLKLFATAILIQKKTGGNLAEVLEKIASVIRERFRLQREVRIFTVHGRFSGFILVVLPIVVAVILYFLNPEYLNVLFKDRTGNYLLGGAVILQIIGILTIRKIINIRI